MMKRLDRVGETQMMNCGLQATIIEYNSSVNITIEFENGNIVEHRTYENFKQGKIGPFGDFSFRIGETREMNNGLKATIIAYRNSMDVDVQFEDGTVARNRQYGAFLGGHIDNREIAIDGFRDRTGETRLMNCGEKATIINYRGSQSIDLMFEDGKVVNNITYSNFKHGRVLSQSKRNRTGETRLMHCGMKATITDYRSSRDIDIEFEDGTVVKNINYNNFKTGSVLNRNSHVNKGKQKIGTTKMMKCGLLATLVDYRDYDDIDVQFEDGKVVYHKRYCNFLRGSIGYADKKHRIEK